VGDVRSDRLDDPDRRVAEDRRRNLAELAALVDAVGRAERWRRCGRRRDPASDSTIVSSTTKGCLNKRGQRRALNPHVDPGEDPRRQNSAVLHRVAGVRIVVATSPKPWRDRIACRLRHIVGGASSSAS
jgi:hypothetical protein